jgi:hypothetical protein
MGLGGRLAITQEHARICAVCCAEPRSRLRFASYWNGCRAATAALEFLPIGFSSDRLGERSISAANNGAVGSALLHRRRPGLDWFHCFPPEGLERVGLDELAIPEAKEVHSFAH